MIVCLNVIWVTEFSLIKKTDEMLLLYRVGNAFHKTNVTILLNTSANINNLFVNF